LGIQSEAADRATVKEWTQCAPIDRFDLLQSRPTRPRGEGLFSRALLAGSAWVPWRVPAAGERWDEAVHGAGQEEHACYVAVIGPQQDLEIDDVVPPASSPHLEIAVIVGHRNMGEATTRSSR